MSLAGRSAFLKLAPLALGVLLAGCNRDQVKVYKLVKDNSTQPVADQQPGGMSPGVGTGMEMPAQNTAAPKLTWTTLPKGWQEQTPGEMRVASFSITGENGKKADVSVIPLPGLAGGDFANLNRWRGQVGLQPVSEDDLGKLAEKIEVGDEPGKLFDLAGTDPSSGNPERILAVIQHRDGMAWFFKVSGDDKLVEQEKPSFVSFLKSVKFGAPETAGLPPGHPAVGAMGMPEMAAQNSGPVSTEGQPDWKVPSDWKPMPSGPFLLAKFSVTADSGAQADVNVSTSAGDGGGLVPNVNRWRMQLGLGSLSADEVSKLVTPVDVVGGKAMFLDMTGTSAQSGQPARMIAAVLPQNGQTWFYKIMGDPKVVEAQKDAFTTFVKTVKY